VRSKFVIKDLANGKTLAGKIYLGLSPSSFDLSYLIRGENTEAEFLAGTVGDNYLKSKFKLQARTPKNIKSAHPTKPTLHPNPPTHT
jgi:hypothetical protein